jgi:transglutaminase/protease-like cytokinesis protein 3
MKSILSYLFILLLPALLHGQGNSTQPDYSKVDAYALTVKNISDPEALSKKLTAPFETPTEKVRAIYRWVTDNVAYDVNGFRNPNLYSFLNPKKAKDSADAAYQFQHAVAKFVIADRKAVCFGYASLFKTLCEYAGIQALVVDGYGRIGTNVIGQPFKSNHSWNVVNIGDKWFLIDATWGAGYTNDNVTAYKKNFNDAYFLAAPENFILDHYPLSVKWTLLEQPPTLQDFFNHPIIYSSFQIHKLHLVNPINGALEAKKGDKIVFEIIADDESPMFGVFDDEQTKTKTLPGDQMKLYTHPDPNNPKILAFEYTVKSSHIHELMVIYGTESILRYKIKVN